MTGAVPPVRRELSWRTSAAARPRRFAPELNWRTSAAAGPRRPVLDAAPPRSRTPSQRAGGRDRGGAAATTGMAALFLHAAEPRLSTSVSP